MIKTRNLEILIILVGFLSATESRKHQRCRRTLTTASGTHAPSTLCSGDLIFVDDFDKLDFKKWRHDSTLAGGGNWEFQWYTNNRSNSFVENGILKIKPTLTSDHLGEEALTSSLLDINGGTPADECTDPAYYGCQRQGNAQNILNPIKSALIRTLHSFSFKYGRIEIRAKIPSGDWLWPAIWLMPRDNAYGPWPSSGEIDIMESRGNLNLMQNGVNIGPKQVGSTLHFGPGSAYDIYAKTHWTKDNPNGFNNNFTKYEFVWSPGNFSFRVDDEEVGKMSLPAGGFWELGGFEEMNLENPWRGGGVDAPFDQEFYIIINLAVGGISYFPDDANNPGGKPWNNKSPKAATDFWDGRSQWLPTWNLGKNEDSFLQIDYVKVYAL